MKQDETENQKNVGKSHVARAEHGKVMFIGRLSIAMNESNRHCVCIWE